MKEINRFHFTIFYSCYCINIYSTNSYTHLPVILLDKGKQFKKKKNLDGKTLQNDKKPEANCHFVSGLNL